MKIVIVGAGQAAAMVIQKYRSLNQSSELILIGEETLLPYERPPLSKQYMQGKKQAQDLLLRQPDWYQQMKVQLRTGQRVEQINREKKTVSIADETLHYDKLVLATGARAAKLPKEITQGIQGLYSVRTVADVDQLLKACSPGSKAMIVGGGYIGLEVAAALRSMRMEVCLIESGERILARVACATTANHIRKLHQDHGVNIMEGVSVHSLTSKNGHLTGAYVSDGSELTADLAVVGIGIHANDELAQRAGIACNQGIMTNEYGQTSDPDIYAAGDCSRFNYRGHNIRLESVGNAIDQGVLVAANLAGEKATYDAKPWFWSDQYDTTLQIAGLHIGYDSTVARKEKETDSLSVWYYQKNTPIAIDSINDAKTHLVARRLIEAGRQLDKRIAANPHANLKQHLKR